MVFWLFVCFILSAVFTKNKVVYGVALIFALAIGYYYLIYLPLAIRKSKALGLRVIVLLPIWTMFSKVLIKTSKNNLIGNWDKAFEIHILETTEYFQEVDRDLQQIKGMLPGLFFWETSAPVPSRIRRLIKDKEKEGQAYWVKGKWTLIPRTPFTARELNMKRVRHGGLINH
mgnify:CR=1 FL=1